MRKLPRWLAAPFAMLILPLFLVAGFGVAANAANNTPVATVEQKAVTPVAPTSTPVDKCSMLSVPVLPVVEGLTYYYETDYSVLPAIFTVRALPTEGHVIADGATSVWTFPQKATEPCPMIVTPAAPVVRPAATCGVQGTVYIAYRDPIEPSPGEDLGVTSEGVTYTQNRIGNIVIVTAKARPSYAIKAGARTQWVLNIPAAKPCQKSWSVVREVPKAPSKAQR